MLYPPTWGDDGETPAKGVPFWKKERESMNLGTVTGIALVVVRMLSHEREKETVCVCAGERERVWMRM